MRVRVISNRGIGTGLRSDRQLSEWVSGREWRCVRVMVRSWARCMVISSQGIGWGKWSDPMKGVDSLEGAGSG